MWAAWNVLPPPERAALADEAVAGFVTHVEEAATYDMRPDKEIDPMEWHRHRLCPVLWAALCDRRARWTPSKPVLRQLNAWLEHRRRYLARRPIFSHLDEQPPWLATCKEPS